MILCLMMTLCLMISVCLMNGDDFVFDDDLVFDGDHVFDDLALKSFRCFSHFQFPMSRNLSVLFVSQQSAF